MEFFATDVEGIESVSPMLPFQRPRRLALPITPADEAQVKDLRKNRRIANHRTPLKSKQYEIIPIEIKAQ